MDEVRKQWEELALLHEEVMRMTEHLSIALRDAMPSRDLPWDSPDRMAWRAWWDKFTEYDYDYWQAYCHIHQAPQWAEFDLS